MLNCFHTKPHFSSRTIIPQTTERMTSTECTCMHVCVQTHTHTHTHTQFLYVILLIYFIYKHYSYLYNYYHNTVISFENVAPITFSEVSNLTAARSYSMALLFKTSHYFLHYQAYLRVGTMLIIYSNITAANKCNSYTSHCVHNDFVCIQ